MKISVTIIVYNEEKKIRQCLESVKNIADQIIVVDSFSEDSTLSICNEFSCKIYRHKFSDYIEQKRFADSKTNYDWILNIDADEKLSDELIDEIMKIKEKQELDYVAFKIPRKTFYINSWLNHCWYPDYKIRLYRKDLCEWTGVKLHEKITVKSGSISRLCGNILHYSFDSISEHLKKIDRFTELSLTEKPNNKITFFTILWHSLWIFIKIYFLKQGFRDGINGFVVAFLSMVHVFVKYTKLRFYAETSKLTPLSH